MTNEEIFQEITKRQQKITEILEASYTFELTPEIMKYKKEIDKLRRKCSHVNAEHVLQKQNGRCKYCGGKL